MTSVFYDFLRRNSVISAGALPLVHTTEAFHLREIWNSNQITTSPCDVFVNEKLNYFFVGRPAYKRRSNDLESQFWELPVCFIIDFSSVTDIRRVFPFDSGAFSGKLFPKFISDLGRDNFELPGDTNLSSKIIGAFFGTASKYFELVPKENSVFRAEFSLDAFDAEIHALHKLATHQPSDRYDDRRFAIEVQSGGDVSLMNNNLLAIICPTIYLDNIEFRRHVEHVWNAEPITYDIFSLNYSNYMYAIYERVRDFYRSKGIL